MKRLKIRIYSPYFPYPITEGAYQVISDQARILSESHDVELVTWMDSFDELSTKVRSADQIFKNVTHLHWGDTNTTKETKFARLLRTAKSLACDIPSPAAFYYPESKDRRHQLTQADIGIYHYTYAWAWLRKDVATESKIIVHFHNVESDLFFLRASQDDSIARKFVHNVNANKLRQIESDLARIGDEYWYVSEKDRVEFRDRFGHGQKPQFVRPPTYSMEYIRNRTSKFLEYHSYFRGAPPNIGFVGTLDFNPSIQSLEWILDNILPLLESANWIGKLKVVGRNPSEIIRRRMMSSPKVEYLGFVDDMENFWGSLSAFMIPHIEGSGVRVKLLDAVASGIPTLANNAAVERVDGTIIGTPALFISDEPSKWVQFILSLRSTELRKSMVGCNIPAGLLGSEVYKDYCD